MDERCHIFQVRQPDISWVINPISPLTRIIDSDISNTLCVNTELSTGGAAPGAKLFRTIPFLWGQGSPTNFGKLQGPHINQAQYNGDGLYFMYIMDDDGYGLEIGVVSLCYHCCHSYSQLFISILLWKDYNIATYFDFWALGARWFLSFTPLKPKLLAGDQQPPRFRVKPMDQLTIRFKLIQH